MVGPMGMRMARSERHLKWLSITLVSRLRHGFLVGMSGPGTSDSRCQTLDCSRSCRRNRAQVAMRWQRQSGKERWEMNSFQKGRRSFFGAADRQQPCRCGHRIRPWCITRAGGHGSKRPRRSSESPYPGRSTPIKRTPKAAAIERSGCPCRREPGTPGNKMTGRPIGSP